MTCLWVVVLFALLYCARRWSHRRYSTPLANGVNNKRRPRRRHRPGDWHRRRLANAQARGLMAALASSPPEPSGRTAVGVALRSGETAYGRTTARLETWSTTTTWVTDTWSRRWGHRARSVTRELTVGGWRDNGEFTWLLTSARALGRSVRSGELVSMPWVPLPASTSTRIEKSSSSTWAMDGAGDSAGQVSSRSQCWSRPRWTAWKDAWLSILPSVLNLAALTNLRRLAT